MDDEAPEVAPGVTRVLLVDDHALFSESLRLALEPEPDIVVVGHASSLAQAERLTADTEPDVVLLDYRLPDGDGVTGIGRLRERRPGARVVVVTASDDDAVLAAAVEAGCAGFVTKSASIHDLLRAIRAAAVGEMFLPASMLPRLLPRLTRTTPVVGADLTARERQVLTLVAEGLQNAPIAERLGISVYTARNHVQNLLGKLGAHSKPRGVVDRGPRGDPAAPVVRDLRPCSSTVVSGSGSPGREGGGVDEKQILDLIGSLVSEEHGCGPGGPAARGSHLTRRHGWSTSREKLDQCWDLLRQRRALQEAGLDPDTAHVRPAWEVESYLQ